VITRHGANQWAICFRCEGKGGSSLRSAWVGLLAWLGGGLALLAAIVALLAWLSAQR